MACMDYQILVDRGFQRSGNFVYKPLMTRTCCPQYVIRMDSRKFKLSKSQKSCIRKFKQYLVGGKVSADSSTSECCGKTVPRLAGGKPIQETGCAGKPSAGTSTPARKEKKTVKPGLGPDPSKPLCKKAKVVRKEMKERKLQAKVQQGEASGPASTSRPQQEDPVFCQDLREYLTLPRDQDCVHKFRTRLVKVLTPEFADTYVESCDVFRKFQTIIHGESPDESGEKQFQEFLVNTPLKYEDKLNDMPTGFGTFHQQYLLDGKIFAVGVLDILPKGVLCEYLYYDPDYRFIAPGVITALLEIMQTQRYYRSNPEMQYYYMGFYVQSCPKMNYKSSYSASSLLCPETYTYVPLERCIPKLKASPYSRLAEEEVEDPDENWTLEMMHPIAVFADMTPMTYKTYTSLHGNHADAVIKEYVKLVGLPLALKMRLFMGRV